MLPKFPIQLAIFLDCLSLPIYFFAEQFVPGATCSALIIIIPSLKTMYFCRSSIACQIARSVMDHANSYYIYVVNLLCWIQPHSKHQHRSTVPLVMRATVMVYTALYK